MGRIFPGAAAIISTPVRLTLALSGLYVVGTLLVFFFLDYQLRHVLVSQIDKSIFDQKARLLMQFKDGRDPALARALRAELQSRGQHDRTYRLLDEKGRVLFEIGDVPLPKQLPDHPGILQYSTPHSTDGSRQIKVRMIGFNVGEQARVEIARSLENTEELMAGFRTAFMISMALILGLGLVGGWFLARRFWQQIDAFNRMSMKIFNAGNLSARMPVTGNDEFAVLATNMNSILDKMEQLFQGVRQVSDNIAHDLRSPLARLRVDVEVTLQENNPQNYRLTLERVLTELQNMQEIFQSLLSLGQAEAGSMKIRKKSLDLSQLLEDIVELYGPLAEDKGQNFESHIPPNVTIEGDRQLLAQAFSNLLDNAVKYVPEGGRIALRAVQHGERVLVQLDDSGPGIPNEMRRKVFDRFVRVDPSRTLPGTGLGLSLVKAFIELHQGKIAIQESRLGGSAFVISLPLK